MQPSSHFHEEKPMAARSGAQHRRLRSSECLRQSQDCELFELHELFSPKLDIQTGAVVFLYTPAYADFKIRFESLKHSVSQWAWSVQDVLPRFVKQFHKLSCPKLHKVRKVHDNWQTVMFIHQSKVSFGLAQVRSSIPLWTMRLGQRKDDLRCGGKVTAEIFGLFDQKFCTSQAFYLQLSQMSEVWRDRVISGSEQIRKVAPIVSKCM